MKWEFEVKSFSLTIDHYRVEMKNIIIHKLKEQTRDLSAKRTKLLFTTAFFHVFLFYLYFVTGISAQFALEQSVISNGGTQSSSGQYTVTGTKGQAVVAPTAFGGSYKVESGFWFEDLGPTAALTSISGRVSDELGGGVSGVTLTLVSSEGQMFSVRSSSLGYFKFDDIEVGNTYTLTFQAKGIRFAQPSILIVLKDEVIGLEIFAIRE